MDTRIHVEKTGDRFTLHAPDHPDLARRAKEFGGRWSGGAWSFPAKNESAVRKFAQGLFGSDGGDGGAKVTLRVDLSLFGEGSIGHEGEAWLAGRMLARRPAFDQRVELGPGVKLVRGGFSVWGGSRQHPALETAYGTVLDVEGVPRTAAEYAAERNPITVAIVDGKKGAVVGPWSKTVTTKTSGPAKPAAAAKAAAPAKAAAAAKASAPAKAKPAAVKAKPVVKARPVAKAKAAPKPAKATKVAKKAKAAVKAVKAKVKSVAKAIAKAAKKAAKKGRKAVKKARAKAGAMAKAVKKGRKAAKAAAKAPARKAGKKRGRR